MTGSVASLRVICCVFVFTVLTTNPIWADDTEIFFGRASSDVKPNVLFILDGSGSMAWYDCANGSVRSSSCKDGTPNGTTSRLARLKSSLKSVLNNTSGVNVGLMRFSHSGSGGRITYPIIDIDQQMCSGKPCGEDTVFTAQSRTSASQDDATELSTGEVAHNESSIALTRVEGALTENAWIGLRFPDLQIPQGATITDARLDVSSASDNASVTNLVIHAEDSTDSASFTTDAQDISRRNRSYNTVSWDAVSKWEDEGRFESPDLANLVQLVVGNTGWCGGNALSLLMKGSGERMISAFDSGSGTAPTLRVSYKLDNVPAGGGCTTTTVLARVSNAKDDATELLSGGISYGTGLNYTVIPVAEPTYRSYGYDSAVRFTNVQVPKDATIVDATLTLVTKNYGWFSSYPSIKISAHNSEKPVELKTNNYNISNRPETEAVIWTDIPTATDVEATSPSLSGIVQGLVTKGNWDSGNPMVFILKPGGSGGHNFLSYDSNPSTAPLLKIRFRSKIQSAQDKISGPVTDVRTEIIKEIDSMVAYHSTPTVGALLEARRYFSGDKVKYGLNRYADTKYTAAPYYWGRYSRVSTPESYTGGKVVRSPGCNINAPDGKYCATEKITDTPVYISPFSHECQSNHIVLLTDGEPTADTTAANAVKSLTGGTCKEQNNGQGTCGEEVATYMSTKDQHFRAGEQNIITHTIGFNFTTQWLKDLAASGGGGYYTADTAVQLSAALANIIKSVQDEGSTFVAPGATVDNFSKVSHRKDIYLALFQPDSSPGWDGNLKRYDYSGNPAALHDANEKPALDPATGLFHDSAKSFWSDSADGNSIPDGGAAGRQAPLGRNLYTYTGSSAELIHKTNEFSIDNDLITASALGLPADDSTSRDNIIKWAMGHDVKDEDKDSNTSESRQHIGDPLHSRPVIITYAGSSEEPDSVIYLGTNDGFLHGIDTESGDEVFSFIPKELIPNLGTLYENSPASDKVYGLDGAISHWIKDENSNGTIEDDDHVYLYMGMRRGGRNYYALDISDRESPKFKWQISGGSSGFEELGQSWSQAVVTNISYLGSSRKVVVFSGGYDESQDNHSTRTIDSIGRALYIVDAEDGSLLWSGGPKNGSGIKSFKDMTYSMPASPRVVDVNGDGDAEQIYVGDMGGRIWRFDINKAATFASDLIDGGIVADFGTDGVIADNRRFYHSPDISSSTINGKRYVNIAMGSGYQAHPLNTSIEDRFYLIRYPYDPAFDEDGNHQYGIPGTSANATGTLNTSAEYTPIVESDLFDATSNILGEGSATEKTEAEKALALSEGWFLKMERSGEKVLGTSVTFDNKLLFASYVPGGAPDGCAPDIGYGIFWAVNLWDATPFAPFVSDDEDDLEKADRNRAIPGGGIPAPVHTLFIETGNKDDQGETIDKEVQILAISGANSLLTLDSKDLIQRVYWSEYPNF